MPTVVVISCIVFGRTCAAADEKSGAISGEKVFATKCASCHGPHGEGTKKTKQRLQGDRSVSQLVELIGKTMPDDDPGTVPADEVRSVAAYIHQAFYSSLARERDRPARIDVSRLTVRQFRQSLADLIGSFRGPMRWEAKAGLKGEYFSGRNFNNNARVLERVDPQLAFDFGVEAPLSEKIEPHEFQIRWQGALLAPETGEYEFTIRTEQAFKLFLNDTNRPLLDGWVKSGNDKEFKATMYLVSGRSYPLRVEFSKAVLGVKDDKNKKREQETLSKQPASISLLWKRPTGMTETIPSRNLSPAFTSPSYLCSTAFPPDDRSYGWERGASVSQEWDQATTEAAIDAAGFVAERLNELAGTKDDAKDRDVKLKNFCRTFAERAWRRPLTAEQSAALIDKQFADAKYDVAAVKRTVLLTILSPRFLYHELADQPDAYDVAFRLSLGLWDSLPGPDLTRAAAGLKTKDQVAKQAAKMLDDPRAKIKLRDFLLTWLNADQARDLAKDDKKFPGFDAAVIADLRTSLEISLDQVLWSEASDFRQLLTSDELYLNGRLAKFYGAELPDDADFTAVKLDPNQRAGVLTHPYLMAMFAHNATSSPVHRGVFLARGILGVSLRPPPIAVAPLAPDLMPSLTTRERVALQTKAGECMTCHGIINPLGFTLEHFDAVGRFRDTENGKRINTSGEYHTVGGRKVTVKDARQLGAFLVDSDEAQTAFVEQMFHHLVQQPVRAFGANTLDELQKTFVADNFNMRKLAVNILANAALVGRPQPPKSGTAQNESNQR